MSFFNFSGVAWPLPSDEKKTRPNCEINGLLSENLVRLIRVSRVNQWGAVFFFPP